MLKTRVAHGYCSRHLAADDCPCANIRGHRDDYITAPEFAPALQDQLADVHTLRDDADQRGWNTEVVRDRYRESLKSPPQDGPRSDPETLEVIDRIIQLRSHGRPL